MSLAKIADEYIRHGWALVPIPPGRKGPVSKGWNMRGGTLFEGAKLIEGWGIGLAHAYSGTMAFDIDDWEMTKGFGVDLDALYTDEGAVIIHSRPGRGKLLYRMPFGAILPSCKMSAYPADGKPVTMFELRCGTEENLSVQDVLPPSTHPLTQQPYRWGGAGHWSRLPDLPHSLLSIWMGMTKDVKVVNSQASLVNASWDEVRDALSSISPDCSRAHWISIGMALHWASARDNTQVEAFALWRDWSAPSYKYPGEKMINAQWASFRQTRDFPVTLGTLFKLAHDNGWSPKPPDVVSMFSGVGRQEILSPQQISQNLRPLPPDLDIALWPEVLRIRADEVSESVGCDPLVPLFAGLSSVCGVVDARTRLELMPGFQVPPVLWLMTLGEPADKKSPGSRPMLAPLKAIEADDRARYEQEVVAWEAREAAYSAAKTAYLDHAKSADFLLGVPLPSLPPIPEKPVSLRITVSDITSQKLVRHAAERPRGLLCYLDEMSSWVRKLTDKTSGEDRSAWVVSYESERYEMDRVVAGAVHCDNLAVSIYGNLQPRVFRANLDALSADGLLQRFVPAVLRQSETRLGNPLPEYLGHSQEWETTLRFIFSLPPMMYHLTPDAFETFRDFQRWYEDAKADERLLRAGDTYMTAFGKLEGLVGRLALVWHMIESPFNPVVSKSLLGRVIAFVRSYVIPAYRYAFGELGGMNTFETWLTEYIIQYADQDKIGLSSLRRAARGHLESKTVWEQTQIILTNMAILEQSKWVVRADEGLKENQGKAEWFINPLLRTMFREHREKVIRARQRMSEKFLVGGRPTCALPRVHGIDEIDGIQ